MLEFRPFNIGDFDYLLITKESNKSPFLPPTDFDDGFFYSLRTFPKNVIQLNTPWMQYRWSKVHQKDTPLRFIVVYEMDVEAHFKRDFLQDAIKVVFIGRDIENKIDLIERFNSNYKLVFYVMLGEENSPVRLGPKRLRHVDDFFEELIENKKDVEYLIDKVHKRNDFNFQLNFASEGGESFNTPVFFNPAQVNYFTLNQSIGNFWETYKEESKDEIIVESKKAVNSEIEDTSRFAALIETVEKIDFLEQNYFDEIGLKLPNTYSYRFAPLVIVSSYNYPHLNDFFEPKLKGDNQLRLLFKSLGCEQRLNYINYFESDEIESEEETQAMMRNIGFMQKLKQHYLDGLSYLHACFKSSPVIRLPFLGNAIKKELSFFRPNAHGGFKSIKTSIEKFGKKLMERVIPSNFVERVFSKPRQIVAITDLPFEWLNVGGLPLALTHDVTRIPEHPLSGIMQYNVMNTFFQVSVSSDILSETLVLFCTSENDPHYHIFYTFYEEVLKLSKELKFKTFICRSINEVAACVDKYKPKLLIFDCHGDYDPDTLSSHLVINDEKMDGEIIISKKISAPIVFLSACFTNPTYGYINGIANAFFQAGSLAVTGTYFPISIAGGSILYIRLLRNLQYAATMPVHQNWLEFISHTIRTSYTMAMHTEILNELKSMNLEDSVNKELSENLSELLVKANVGLMNFEYRFSVMNEYPAEVLKIVHAKVPDFKFDFDLVEPEHLFYTNLGRGDLIAFDCWIGKYNALNKL